MSGRVLVPGLDRASVTDWIRQHALRAAGALPLTRDEVERSVASKLDPPGLDAWLTVPEPADFRQLRRNRLVMGTIRYEYDRNCVRLPDVSYVGSCLARWEEYQSTGNREHLVDVANLAAIEWRAPIHDLRVLEGSPEWHSPSETVGYCLGLYQEEAFRCCLAAAVDAVRREWLYPTHPTAHWKALDCGGHWSLRNQKGGGL